MVHIRGTVDTVTCRNLLPLRMQTPGLPRHCFAQVPVQSVGTLCPRCGARVA